MGGRKNTLTQLQQEPQSKLTIATMTTLAPSDIDIVVHTQSLPLVQQQLSALETGHLIWRGEIWPNQLMEWDISDHSSSGHEPVTDEVSSHWQMQLSMTLPKLGEVTANIVINANCMHIRLHTAATETAEFLRNNRPPLATAIASTGLSVQSVEIHANDNE